MYAQSKNGLGEIDWGGLLNSAVNAYGQYSQIDAQKDVLKLQLEAQKQAQQNALNNPFLSYTQNPNYSPVYGGQPSGTFNLMPWLLIGGVALAAFFILKK